METQSDHDQEVDLNLFEEPSDFRPTSPEPNLINFQRTNGHHLNLRLVGGHPLWGHVLYPAAISMSKYLETNSHELLNSDPTHHSSSSTPRSVLELGAGAGLPGLTSVLEGAGLVVSTDFPDPDLINNLIYNADQNLPRNLRDRLIVEGFTWGTNPDRLLNHLQTQTLITPSIGFDVILLSDLVFNHSQHQALLSTCQACLKHQTYLHPHTPCLLIFYSHHRPQFVKADEGLIELATQTGWIAEKVTCDPLAGLAFPEDDGDREIRGTVHGWKLTRG